MSVIQQNGSHTAIGVLAIATLGVFIWLFTGPTIDLGPRTQRPTVEEKTPDNNPKPRDDGQPGPGIEAEPGGRGGKGPQLPDCEGFARVQTTGRSAHGSPIYQIFDHRGRTLGFIHRDPKWRRNPRQSDDCEIFEIYDPKGRPVDEIDCQCNSTGRAPDSHKKLN